jgi:hypothetical protein
VGRTYNERRLNYARANTATCLNDVCSDPIAGDDDLLHDYDTKDAKKRPRCPLTWNSKKFKGIHPDIEAICRTFGLNYAETHDLQAKFIGSKISKYPANESA